MAEPLSDRVIRKIDQTAELYHHLVMLQEDPKLLMWFDQAVTRTGEGT